MSLKKEDSVMGLPRVSGSGGGGGKRRRWSADEDDEEDDDHCPLKKVVCTSPPYALCAEDVLPQGLPPASAMSLEEGHQPQQSGEEDEEMTTATDLHEESFVDSDCDDEDEEEDDDDDEDAISEGRREEEDEENFIDDDEDKDSGFIDGNSIDNSSDDDSDVKGDASFNSSASTMTTTTTVPVMTNSSKKDVLPLHGAGHPSSPETDLQSSLAKVLPSSPSNLAPESMVEAFSTPSPISVCSATPSADGSSSFPKSNNVTTVTAVQTGTIVTSAYQGSVPTPSYDLHGCYQSSPQGYHHHHHQYQNRPCTPSWSCTFYDGSQPTTTNKYMEISPPSSPNRGVISPPGQQQQSIQCDENGKSYLELGSASPYTNTYSNECGNFTTSPSTYNGNSYSQSFSGSPNYPAGNGYFCGSNRSTQNSPYVYHGAETSYGGYEGEESTGAGGCSYGYMANGAAYASGRPPQRCSSAICDPTRTSPRPACYPQQRMSVLNLSMFKLNRFSRFPEPSLHRSVLICNTLRHIEKEMESEGLNMAAILSHSHNYGVAAAAAAAASSSSPLVGTNNLGSPPPPPCGGAETMPSMPSTNVPVESGGPLPSIHTTLLPPPPHHTPPPSTSPYSNDSSLTYSPHSPYPHDGRDSPIPFVEPSRETLPLRPFSPPPPQSQPPVAAGCGGSGDARPPLMAAAAASSEEDSPPSHRLCEDRTEGINWCSVLSLSSQTDLDSMNNNEWSSEAEASCSAPSSSSTLASLTTRSIASSSSPPGTNPSGVHYPPEQSDDGVISNHQTWKLPSLSADDVLKSFPEPPRRQEEDLDSIIKVLVGS